MTTSDRTASTIPGRLSSGCSRSSRARVDSAATPTASKKKVGSPNQGLPDARSGGYGRRQGTLGARDPGAVEGDQHIRWDRAGGVLHHSAGGNVWVSL
jgi:hypothetical protein